MPRLQEIERARFPEEAEGMYVHLFGLLEEHFAPRNLDDITDIDRETTCDVFLVSLNKGNEKLLSDEIDVLLETDDAYFLEITISREKPLALAYFMKYPKGSRGQILHHNQQPFLEEHKAVLRLYEEFAEKYGLLMLTDANLQELVEDEGRPVSIYYKYFGQTEEDPTAVPF